MALGTAIAALTGLGGLALTAKGQSDAKKAAAQANTAAQTAQVNIPEVSRLAEEQALRNLQLSRDAEQVYAPENAAFRSGSIQSLLQQLQSGNPDASVIELLTKQLQGGGGPFGASASQFQGAPDVQSSSYNPAASLTGRSYDPVADVNAASYNPAANVSARNAGSGLLSDAIAKARSDLALGGALPQDVRNLVARNAAAKGGMVGSIQLGRDISARDLGLTSLDLAQRRLQNAQSLGAAELASDQFNVSNTLTADQFNASARNSAYGLNAQLAQQVALANAAARNSALSQNAQLAQQADSQNAAAQNAAGALNAQLAQQAAITNAGNRNQVASQNAQLAQQASLANAGNNMNIAQLIASLNSGDFGRSLAAAQFGQTLAQPVVGLDPSSIANLAVGNSNMQAGAAQNAASIAANRAAGTSQLGGQLLGYGLSGYNSFQMPQRTSTLPTYTVPSGVGLGASIPSVPGWSPSR